MVDSGLRDHRASRQSVRLNETISGASICGTADSTPSPRARSSQSRPRGWGGSRRAASRHRAYTGNSETCRSMPGRISAYRTASPNASTCSQDWTTFLITDYAITISSRSCDSDIIIVVSLMARYSHVCAESAVKGAHTKVKVHTLDIAPLRSETPPQKRSGMARVLKGFHSFTCTPTQSSAIGMSHTCLCLPSRSWYSFTDPGGMEG